MKKSISIFLLCTLFSISLYANDYLSAFELEDQFEVVHDDKEFLGEQFIMIGGSSKSVELHKKFIQKIRKNTSSTILSKTKIVSVFNMKRVPSLLKFYARGKFPKDKKKWMLLDWNGEMASRYKFQEKGLNILIFDKEGLIVYRSFEVEIDDKHIEQIISILKDK